MPKASAGRFTWPDFAVWCFGFLSAGHRPVFDWEVAAPWWISSFIPNLEAELGLALMFASNPDLRARLTQASMTWLAYSRLRPF